MNLQKIKTETNWGDAVNRINSNNQTIGVEVEKLKNSTTKCKGYFTSPFDLSRTYPKANPGDKAYVGLNYPYRIFLWNSNGNVWYDSGELGGEENVSFRSGVKYRTIASSGGTPIISYYNFQLNIYNENRFAGTDLIETPKLPNVRFDSELEYIPFIVKSFNYAYFNCSNLKVVDYGRKIRFYGNCHGAFKKCHTLVRVGSPELPFLVNDVSTLEEIFFGDTALEEVYFAELNRDLDLSATQHLKKESLLFIINNSIYRNANFTLKIDLHLYDDWINHEDVRTALRNHGYLSLAKN